MAGHMDDRDIERLLSRYQPLPPPGDLRARALTPVGVGRTWPWAAAAALLFGGAALAIERETAKRVLGRVTGSTRLEIINAGAG